MNEANYYPLGAYTDPSAPWNYSRPDEREFEVCVSQTLSKRTSVNTNDYVIEEAYLDKDEGGGYPEEILTYTTDWNKAYNEEHYTPLELIGLLKKIYEDELDCLQGKTVVKHYSERQLKDLIEECSNWVEDETEIIEE